VGIVDIVDSVDINIIFNNSDCSKFLDFMADFYLAPLRGITDRIFRNVYEPRFGRFDYMVAPFIPTILGSRVKEYHIRDLLSNNNDIVNDIDDTDDINHTNSINCINNTSDTNNGDGNNRLIPQIIGRDPAGFLLLSRKFADMGFTSVNWNLGCPAPLVAKKARGCGLLPHTDIIKRFLDEVTPKLPLPLSIKARLGYESPDELETLIPLFNDYPIKELMIHPRTGVQLYEGTVDIDRFEACLSISKHTVVYNGDIVSIDTFRRLSERFPGVNRWMIGRGIVRNPFLLTELRQYVDGTGSSALKSSVSTRHTVSIERSVLTESAVSSVSTESSISSVSTKCAASTNRDASQIIGFLNDLIDACKDHPHPIKVLGRMKEIWRYLGSGTIDGWEELSARVIRCKSLQEYMLILERCMN